MTDKLQFPDGFLWGGATAANQCEEFIMKTAVASHVDVVPIGPDRHAIITVRKRCSTLKKLFLSSCYGIDMYHR